MNSSSHFVLAYLRSVVTRTGAIREDDCELLRRLVQRRDEEAFTVLLQRHGPMVLNLARRITGDEQTAEDVLQAAFLWLFRKGHTIRRPHSLSCWLHGVAYRLSLQARRARGRRHRQETFARPSSPSGPLDELTAQEFLAVLDEELTKLPEKDRAPLILCCLEGLSQEEAARRLGCSAGAVRGRLERGRQRLRLRLEKRGMTMPAVLGGTLLIAGAPNSVPAGLLQATLQASMEGSPSPAVAVLIEEAMRTTLVNQFKAIGTAVMLLVLMGTGVGMFTLLPPSVKEKPPAVAANADKRMSSDQHVDLFGDPLPKGAVMRLGTLQRRAVNAQLAVAADGKSIISVRNGKYLTIWDAATGQRRQSRQVPVKIDTANDHGDNCSLSPDGRLLATSTIQEGKVTIWDVPSGKVVRELVIDKADFISNIAFSPDGKHLAADGRIGRGFVFGFDGAIRAGNDLIQMLRVWQVSDGKEIFATDLRQNWACHFFAFSQDGKLLIVSFNYPEEGTCCWDLAEKRLRWQSKNFGEASMLLTPDDKLFSPRQAKALDLATGQPAKIENLPPLTSESHVAFSPDGRKVLFSTMQGVGVWDRVRSGQLLTLAAAGEQFVFFPDGKSILTNNGSLQRWDVATGKPQWSDTFALGHVGEVVALAFSADGRRLVSGSTDGSVRLWDAQTGRPLRVWRGHKGQIPLSGRGAGVRALDISADGRRIVSAGNDECIKLWDAASDREVRIISLPHRGPGAPDRNIYHVRFSFDGKRIIGCFGARANIGMGEPPPELTDQIAAWDSATGALLELCSTGERGHDSGVLAPDGQTWLVGHVLFDVRTGKKRAELPGRGKSDAGRMLNLAAFSNEGALVVSDAEKLEKNNGSPYIAPDGVRVWETATGKVVARLKTTSWVAQTAFLPDHRFLALNDLDGIQVRDVRSGEVVVRFPMPESIRAGRTPGSYASCLAFTRDGRRMATGHPDSTILVWEVPLPPSRTTSVSTKQLESLWADLADADAAKAWRAVWRLADAPQDALPFLRQRVNPCSAVSAEITQKLVADLDSDSFPRREAAMKRLRALGPQVEPALRAALKAKPSPEQKRRIEELLAALPAALSLPSSEESQQLRALIVLERIGTPEARRLLEEVAKGPPWARLTRQAQAALACLP